MRYDELEIDGVTLLTVHGDIIPIGLGHRLVDHIRALLMDDKVDIVLDLSGVRHIDSQGLGLLVDCFSAARKRGGVIKLLGVNGRLSDLLVISRLVNVFECFDTREAALASFAPVAMGAHA